MAEWDQSALFPEGGKSGEKREGNLLSSCTCACRYLCPDALYYSGALPCGVVSLCVGFSDSQKEGGGVREERGHIGHTT